MQTLQQLKANPILVNLNKESLKIYFEQEPVFKEIMDLLHSNNIKINEDSEWSMLLEKFNYFDIKSIEDIKEIINNEKELFLEFTKSLFTKFKSGLYIVHDTFPIMYFQHYLASRHDEDYLNKYFLYGTWHYSAGAEDFISEYQGAKKKLEQKNM